MARGLVQRKSYAIGVVVPDLSNPFFMDVVTGVQRVAAEAGYAVLPGDVRETSPERHLDALRARQVDGLILDGFGALALAGGGRWRGSRWCWWTSRRSAFPAWPATRPSAGRLAAEHLHRPRPHAAGVHRPRERRVRLPDARARLLSGAARGGAGAHQRAAAARAAHGGRRAGGHEGAARPAAGERPTAVFCATDLLAAGALKACLTAGIAVPGEMCIVGCDDIELARVLTPELTTVRIPARELGARAARLLIKQLDDEGWVPRPASRCP